MNDVSLMVDGNALAGPLREVFIQEMTTARITCDGCGHVDSLGAEHAYIQAPGIVLRCCNCEGMLLAMTKGAGGYVLGFKGCRSLEIASEPE
jgi:hypothetical protein